jgi:hypothetical protein
MAAIGFKELMSRFGAHLKLTASKWFARRKIEQMERDAAKEDETKEDNVGKLRRRTFNKELMRETFGRWD